MRLTCIKGALKKDVRNKLLFHVLHRVVAYVHDVRLLAFTQRFIC